MIRPYLTFLALMFVASLAFSQTNFEYGLERDLSIVVTDSTDTLSLAWAGGLNSVHFNEMDLNFDGIMDLVAFDKHGERIIPLLNSGNQGQNSYSYAPQYEDAFPQIYSWLITRDYDCDGYMDIFSYGFGGIRVYRNNGPNAGGLSFQLKTALLNSLQNGNLSNILLSDMDYPAIDDVDGDGDLDVLTFYGLGSYLQYHKNMSVENYGNCQHLEYMLVDRCWGKFAESESSNLLTLNISCPWSKEPDPKQVKHTGSTMQLIDLDNDSVMDLLLGDVDFMNIIALANNGTTDSAYISSQDTVFPPGYAVDVVSVPVPSWMDIDNDGVRELIYSPFESRTNIPSNFENVWLYENAGTNSLPIFQLASKSFLQDRMIDVGAGAHPVFVDYDGDSLLDIVVGNYGYLDSNWYSFGNLESSFVATLALFRNTGTAQQPSFDLVDRDFANLSQYGFVAIRPAFGDIDGDGDQDMIIGDRDGVLHLFSNSAGAGNPLSLALTQMNYAGIDVGLYATPQLVDLDRDSKLDLVIGYRGRFWTDSVGSVVARMAGLSYYRNTGTGSNPSFTLQTDSLGGVDATDGYLNPYYGYSVPWFFTDSIGDWQLFLGSVNGLIYHYIDIENNLGGSFTRKDTVFHMINDSVPHKVFEGIYASPVLADLNGDGYPEMICGNFAGGMSFYLGTTPPPGDVSITENPAGDLAFAVYPNPSSGIITIDLGPINGFGMLDLKVSDISGRTVREYREAASYQQQFDLGKLSPGIYILNIRVGSNAGILSGSRKLIIH